MTSFGGWWNKQERQDEPPVKSSTTPLLDQARELSRTDREKLWADKFPKVWVQEAENAAQSRVADISADDEKRRYELTNTVLSLHDTAAALERANPRVGNGKATTFVSRAFGAPEDHVATDMDGTLIITDTAKLFQSANDALGIAHNSTGKSGDIELLRQPGSYVQAYGKCLRRLLESAPEKTNEEFWSYAQESLTQLFVLENLQQEAEFLINSRSRSAVDRSKQRDEELVKLWNSGGASNSTFT